MADQEIPQSNAAPEEASETESGESQETQQGAPATPATKTEAKKIEKQLKKLKLKVDGQEEDYEFDPNDDEFMTRQFQLAKMGQKRAQEYSSLQKEVVKFVEELRKNPRKALSDPAIGIDVKQLAASIIESEIENSKKSPDQLAREQIEEELRALKEEREKEKSEAQAQEFERLKEQQFERYDVLMEQALNKTDLPKTPYVVKKIADYMLLGLQEGKDVTPEDVIPLVQEEMREDLKEMFRVMPDEVIASLVGKDVFDRMRKKNVAKAKEKVAVGANKAADVVKKAADAKKEAAPKKTFKDFFGV